MRVIVRGRPVQLVFRYVERHIGKKIVQPGMLVQLRSYAAKGTAHVVFGESLHFVDSRDKFDKVRARREGLIEALADACRNECWGREERLTVWRVYQTYAQTLGHESFAPFSSERALRSKLRQKNQRIDALLAENRTLRAALDSEREDDGMVDYGVVEALSREMAKQWA